MAVPSGLDLGIDSRSRVAEPSDPPAPIGPGGVWTRIRRSDAAAVVAVSYIALVIVLAAGAPLWTAISGWGPYDFDQTAIDPDLGGMPIGWGGGMGSEHWLGVEPGSGRDIFARIVYGARVSMIIALSAAVLSSVIAVLLGLVAGFYGGLVDLVISRVMDFLMAFPTLIFMIAVLSALPAENRQALLVFVIAFFGWPYLGRVVRGQTISLSQREFVEAARVSGASGPRIILTEILPNLRSTLIVMVTLAIPGYIGTEAGLSFLGVGVVPPTPSWGQMIAASVSWYAVDPAYFAIPSLFLFALVLSFTVLGERLRLLLDSERSG